MGRLFLVSSVPCSRAVIDRVSNLVTLYPKLCILGLESHYCHHNEHRQEIGSTKLYVPENYSGYLSLLQ